MREEESDMNHQFDIWHFCKSIKTRVFNAAKKKSCKELMDWIKSICNHVWWCCATCENDEVLLREKWQSLIFHVQNIYDFPDNIKFKQCEHHPISTEEQRHKNG